MSSVAIAALTSAAIQFAVLIAVYASRDNDTYQKFVANTAIAWGCRRDILAK
jgi:hypothetical protein